MKSWTMPVNGRLLEEIYLHVFLIPIIFYAF
jgi:hypothetical protein